MDSNNPGDQPPPYAAPSQVNPQIHGQAYPPQPPAQVHVQNYPPQATTPVYAQGYPAPVQGQAFPAQGQAYPGQAATQGQAMPPKGAPQVQGQVHRGLPQSDPSYGYDQRPVNQTTTNVIQVQPSAANTIIVTTPERPPSMAGYVTLACLVFWFCNPLFGAIAFFLAISAASDLSAENRDTARKLGRASMWVSISGVILSVIITISVVAWATTVASKAVNDGLNDLNDDLNDSFSGDNYIQ